MGDVIKKDFGKEEREQARVFARLLKLSEDREQDILENPGVYIAMAHKRLLEQELFLNKLWEALRLPWARSIRSAPIMRLGEPMAPEPFDTVVIDRRDYEAFEEVKRLINARKAD